MATLRIHAPGTGVKVYHIYKKLTSLGKGEEEPVAENTSAEGRANNRRVEIVISRSKSASK